MLKSAIEKILSLKDNKIYEINGATYSDNDLVRIEEYVARPEKEYVSGLESIVKLIRKENEKEDGTIYIRVSNYHKVNVFTSYDKYGRRNRLYEAESNIPEFHFGWRDYESAMISFRSQFEQTEGIEYLLGILSRITDENSITSKDNGITQEVEARKGIALATKETIKPRVKLTPFRTFLEVEQPESEFLIRLREGGEIGIFEADGGMWQLKAKQKIKEYFENELEDLISSGKVVVMI